MISGQNFDYGEHNTCRKTTLDNGLRVVTEHLPYVQSVSLGIWVRSGSRFEEPEFNGICHFIEHMLFKGTARRSAFAIAREMDSVGMLNAFTSKEFTSFDSRVLTENLDLAADLLGDIFLNPSFPEDELEREKQVICQEIHQMEDVPEDLVHELMDAEFWGDDRLGQPILGTIPIITKLDRDTISDFKRRHYTSDATIICASGNLDHDRVVDLFRRDMEKLPHGLHGGFPACNGTESVAQAVQSDLEQVHVSIGLKGPGAVDENRYAGYILNTILGGSGSSRLFQEVREKRGLSYSVYSFLSSFSDTGMFGIYAGCDPNRLEELLTTIGKETFGLAAGITEEDIVTAKSHIRGNLILAMESTETRMNRLAKSEYYYGRHVPMTEIIDAIERVTAEELRELAEGMINRGRCAILALGPVEQNVDLFGLFNG